MLLERRSPGPPWLPIPPFSDLGTLIVGAMEGVGANFIAALVLADRRFAFVSTTPWTLLGGFGLRLGAGSVVVPNDAQWWAVGVTRLDDDPIARPWDVFRMRWRLHL